MHIADVYQWIWTWSPKSLEFYCELSRDFLLDDLLWPADMRVKGVFFKDAHISNAFAGPQKEATQASGRLDNRSPRAMPLNFSGGVPCQEQNLHGAADVLTEADECLADSPLVVDPLQPDAPALSRAFQGTFNERTFLIRTGIMMYNVYHHSHDHYHFCIIMNSMHGDYQNLWTSALTAISTSTSTSMSIPRSML